MIIDATGSKLFKELQLGVKGNIQKSFVKFAFVAMLWNLSH